MTAILGISAYYHDSAAALLVDGKMVAAAQEERFTRKKHDARFPEHAVRYCLEEAGLGLSDLEFIAFYDKPILKFDRLLETYLAFAPSGFGSFRKALPIWLKEKLFLRSDIRRRLKAAKRASILFLEHHESHAASAFFPSPFSEAAVMTMDGVGEWSTSTLGFGKGNALELTRQMCFPHSLGLLYSAFTYYCGFKVNSGEYKLMGLAPYGQPKYRDVILNNLLDLREDGSFWMDMRYFGFADGLTMTNEAFAELFGAPARKPESQIERRHMDLAASIQAVTEEIVLRSARFLRRLYDTPHLTLAGGVALNCVANGKLLGERIFDRIWIQPAAGDAGGALGAAWFVWHQLLENPRPPGPTDRQQGSLLGPAFSDEVIRAELDRRGIPYEFCQTESELVTKTAQLLSQEKVVGWFQGRMEFGPRALGARSILGDARSPKMQSTMNLKIKYRESFRPFAPIVRRERASEWFELNPEQDSPYMLIVAPVRPERRVAIEPGTTQTSQSETDLLARVNAIRSTVPAVTHVDYSARLQTVGEGAEPRLQALLAQFEALTGCPILINTSFNVRGEPIVNSIADALRCFAATEMDALAIGRCLLTQASKKVLAKDVDRASYINRFELD